jgi:hypothetical protein
MMTCFHTALENRCIYLKHHWILDFPSKGEALTQELRTLEVLTEIPPQPSVVPAFLRPAASEQK